MHSHHPELMYQPSAFGKEVSCVRGDSKYRYNDMRKDFQFKGLSVLDFGCAEGYFGFRALLDGAESCTFIDNDRNCLKEVDQQAITEGFATKVKIYEKLGKDNYDVAICLDLWSEKGVPTLKEFKEIAKVLFISTSGEGRQKNQKLLDEAAGLFSEVIPVHTGYQDRTIYRCKQ